MTDVAKHTPGPWGLETVPTSIGICHQIGPFPSTGYMEDNHACVYVDGRNSGGDSNAVELLANARLIAAAPELLEALEEMLRTHKAAIYVDDGVAELVEPEETWMDARAQAVAAIAKAVEGVAS